MDISENNDINKKKNKSRKGFNNDNPFGNNFKESKKYGIRNKNDKDIDKFVEDNELTANEPVVATLLIPRKHVSFRTSKLFSTIYKQMQDFMILKKGTKYSKQTFFDAVMYYGYSNLKNLGNPAIAVIQLYKELQICSPRICKKNPQMLDFNLESRAFVQNFQLTKDQEVNVETIINRYIFDISQHSDIPYIMLILSFIHSDYDEDIQLLFEGHVEDEYNIMIDYINNINRNIYKLNIDILKNVSSFSAKETYCVIQYCNKLLSILNDRTDPNIKKQAELIVEFCKWIKEDEHLYYKSYPRIEPRLTGDSIDNLIKWADEYNNKSNQEANNKEKKESNIF
jgi:hypothetical protein